MLMQQKPQKRGVLLNCFRPKNPRIYIPDPDATVAYNLAQYTQ